MYTPAPDVGAIIDMINPKTMSSQCMKKSKPNAKMIILISDNRNRESSHQTRTETKSEVI